MIVPLLSYCGLRRANTADDSSGSTLMREVGLHHRTASGVTMECELLNVTILRQAVVQDMADMRYWIRRRK